MLSTKSNDGDDTLHGASSATRAAGFTLAELMLTLAVVGVSVTIGVPSFHGLIQNQRRVTTVNELVMALSLARSEAIKQSRHVTLCKSADGVQCSGAEVGWEAGWMIFANTAQANAATREADEPILRSFDALSGRTLRSPDLGAEFIAYRPSGTANATGTWILCDSRGAEHALAVVVDAAGRPRVRHTQADDSALECPA